MLRAGGMPPFWTTDAVAAYRRARLRPERWLAAHIAFVVNDAAMAAQQWPTPFEGAGEACTWERLGRFLVHCEGALLYVAARRCVGDFFGPDCPGRAAHAMACIAELVRAMLGPSSIADGTRKRGSPLAILGAPPNCNAKGMTMFPAPAKVAIWACKINTALQAQTTKRAQRRARCIRFAERTALPAGSARKLASALSRAAARPRDRVGWPLR